MAKCEYEIKYTHPKKGGVKYKCPYKSLKKTDVDDKNHCVFHHSKQEDKNSNEFYKRFKKLYDSGNHDFTGFIFPKDFDFRKLEEENENLEFKDAIFSFTKFLGRAKFNRGTKFHRMTDFLGARFLDTASFEQTKFLGETNFYWARFSGNSYFSDAKFSENAYFVMAEFSKNISFDDVTFSGETFFRKVKFFGKADFDNTTFSGEANFLKTIFQEIANFQNTKFLGKTIFLKTKFWWEVKFLEANFFRSANFNNVLFSKTSKVLFNGKSFEDRATVYFQDLDIEDGANIIFDRVNLNRARFLGTDLEKINFKRVYWNNMKYETEEEKKANGEIEEKKKFEKIESFFKKEIEFRVILESIKKMWRSFVKMITGEDRIKVFDETFQKGFRKKGGGEKKHYEVQQLYNQLRLNYERTGRYHEAGDFFVGAMEMRKKGTREGILTRLILFFYKWISLCGERPIRAFGWLVFLILISGLVNLAVGINPESSGIVNQIIRCNVLSLEFLTNPLFCNHYLKALSVSISIFTLKRVDSIYVLSNGDWGPIILTIQTALAALFLSLFILAMNRKFRRTKD